MFISKNSSFNKSPVFKRYFHIAQAPRPEPPAFNRLAALLHRWLPVWERRRVVGDVLEHMGTLPLTAQSSLALVRLNDETLLLGVTQHSIRVLAKGRRESAVDSADKPSSRQGIEQR